MKFLEYCSCMRTCSYDSEQVRSGTPHVPPPEAMSPPSPHRLALGHNNNMLSFSTGCVRRYVHTIPANVFTGMKVNRKTELTNLLSLK